MKALVIGLVLAVITILSCASIAVRQPVEIQPLLISNECPYTVTVFFINPEERKIEEKRTVPPLSKAIIPVPINKLIVLVIEREEGVSVGVLKFVISPEQVAYAKKINKPLTLHLMCRKSMKSV